MTESVPRSPAEVRAVLGLTGPYLTRPLRFLELRRIGDWRMKLYGIATHGRAVRPALVEATADLAVRVLPRPAFAEGRCGVGFAIAHDAVTACIGLVYWWEAANELHQRNFAGPLDDPRAMTPIEHPAAGCVWELGIIDFERRRWIEDVLANPAGPDLERYLSRRLNEDV